MFFPANLLSGTEKMTQLRIKLVYGVKLPPHC